MEFNEGIVEEFLLNPKYRIIRHVLFWIFMYSTEFLALFGILIPLDEPFSFIIELVLDLILVYSHLYFFIPKMLMKRRYWSFLFCSFASLCFVVIVDFYLYDGMEDPEFAVEMLIGIFTTTASLLLAAMALKIFKNSFNERVKINQLEAINLKSDIKMLQDQINPHFLFNALNSIYVQSKKRSEKVPEAIMQLSELMRYQTYDSQKESVKLEDEINYLKNYLHIERERRDNLKIGFIIQGDPSGIQIPPLLFLPIIENAVKHSQTSDGTKAFINVKFNISKEILEISVANSKSNYNINEDKEHGKGLQIFNNRLALLFSEYTLNQSEFDAEYFSELSIKLNSRNQI